MKHLFKWGAQYEATTGTSISFWDDPWLGDVPLRIKFPSLYTYCADQKATVAELFDGEEWNITFNRSFSNDDLVQWNNLMIDLQAAELNNADGSDKVSWALTKNKQFTTQSLYRFITHGGDLSGR